MLFEPTNCQSAANAWPLASRKGNPAGVALGAQTSIRTERGGLTVNGLLGTIWYGPVYGTAQSIVPPHMRATTSAILLFIINLIGLGLGPLFVGALSDASTNYLLNGTGLDVGACIFCSACPDSCPDEAADCY